MKNAGIDIKKFKIWLLENVGKKCSEYAVGCFACDSWRIYEGLENLLEVDKKHKRIKIK